MTMAAELELVPGALGAPRFRVGARVVDRIFVRGCPNYGVGTVTEVRIDAAAGIRFYIVLFDDGALRAIGQRCLEPADELGVYSCGVPQ